MRASTLKQSRLELWSAAIVAALSVTFCASTARADDDWWERWEDYREELEERREDARELAEERWEDEQERLEEYDEDGWRRGPCGRQRYWVLPGGSYMPPPHRYRAEYFSAPLAEYYEPRGPIVYRNYEPVRTPLRARYYGVPGAGYVEGPYGGRSVQVVPIRVFWAR